jgi:hypothetical protein
MAVQKNFTVKNGFEVSGDLIYADSNQNKVGIATTNLTHTLTVKGDISVTNVDVGNQLTINGPLSLGSSLGASGQFLVSTGAGVTWSQLPGLRTTQTFTATEGQSTFNFSYNPSVGVDAYVNGIKLPPSEYNATNGASILLNDPCFDQDTVEFVAYSVSALAIGNTGITGLTIQDEGISVGNAGNIVSLNFVGAGVTSTLSGFGVTVYLSDYASSSGVSTSVIGGIASVTSVTAGIVTATNGFISVANTTPIQISLVGNQLTFTAVGIGSTTFGLF